MASVLSYRNKDLSSHIPIYIYIYKEKKKRKRILKRECEEKIWLEVKNSSLHFTLATMQM